MSDTTSKSDVYQDIKAEISKVSRLTEEWVHKLKHLASRGTVLCDREIVRLCEESALMDPYVTRPTRAHEVEGEMVKVISYGPSSYGYDIRLGHDFLVFTDVFSSVVDPKAFDDGSFVRMSAAKTGFVQIPPNSFALGSSLEYMRIPRDILALVYGKSTYARCGIVVNCTPLEPEWQGHITLEFSNTTPLPARLYAGEGCAQVVFNRVTEICDTSYADRSGKYQGQTGVTLPTL